MENDSQEEMREPAGKAGPEKDKDGVLIRPPRKSLLSNLWSSFLAGVVVVAPIAITVALVYWFLTGPMAEVDTFVKRVIPENDSSFNAIFRATPFFGVLVAFAAIVLLGAFAKNFVGRAFIRTGEEILDAVPIVRNLYRFFKNVFETALQQSARSFKEVALVEYPRPGAWALSFVIGESRAEIAYRLRDEGEEMTAVFVPTVPNPTSGFLLYVPRSTLRPLSMTVEDAAKLIFSIGLVVPEFVDPDEAVKRLEEIVKAAAPERKPVFRLSMRGRRHGRDKSSRNESA